MIRRTPEKLSAGVYSTLAEARAAQAQHAREERIAAALERLAEPAEPADERAARYGLARAKLIAEGRKPTDALVAEALGVDARTVRNWRHKGLIS